MSTNPSPNPVPNNQPSSQPQNASWREQRRAARQARRAERSGSTGGAWLFGAILIVIGTVFLLQSMGRAVFGNWWALFILLPAAGAFSAAWRSFSRSGGQLGGATLSSLAVGLVLTLVTIALFFNFDLTWAGPIALIVIGVGVLVTALTRSAAS